MKSKLLAASFAALCGCAGSPVAVLSMTDQELAAAPWAELCNTYAFTGHANERIRAELKRRDAEIAAMPAGSRDPITGGSLRKPFTDEEWLAIDRGSIFIGMSEPALICSWGVPNTFTGGDINRTVTAAGERRQYVFRSSQYASASYVYVENGRVAAWQD